MNTDDSGYRRLEDQISWYDKKSGSAQRNYKLTKYFTLAASAAIPILALYELNEVVAVLMTMYQHENSWSSALKA
jgi:hypothetical protein